MTDIHGQLEGQEVWTRDTKEKYVIGGLLQLSGMVDILQRQADGKAFLINSGDMYTGSLISSYFKGSVITQVMNQMNVSCSAVGNHEFDVSWQSM